MKKLLFYFLKSSPSASPEFEGRGAETVNATLSATLRTILSNPLAMDWKSLAISATQCWVVYVDCIVLDSDGNLIDALALAVKAALYNTRYVFFVVFVVFVCMNHYHYY